MKIVRITSISILILIISSSLAFYSSNASSTNSQTNTNITTIESSNQDETGQINRNSFQKQEEKSIESEPLEKIESISQSEGDTRLFWVPDVSESPYEFYQINATLKIVGQNTLIYSNTTLVTDSKFLGINNSFETNVYPRITEFFGSPPDIDQDGKIIILVYDIDEIPENYIAGYFWALNQYKNDDLPPSDPYKGYSNEAEILHIDILATENVDTIAHEFQHLIHFTLDEDEHSWLNEGASMFSEYLIGGDPFSGGVGTNFQANPDISLTYWSNSLENYGASYTFFLYLAEKYGGISFIQDLVQRQEDGIDSIEDTLLVNGYDVTFVEVFRNWTVANFLDDTSFANGAYGFYNDSVNVNHEVTYSTSPLPRTDNTVPYWGTDYIQFNYPNDLPFNFEFQGDSDSGFLVTIILENTTTDPIGKEVIPLVIEPDGAGNYSTSAQNKSADEIYVVISSFTTGEIPNYSDEEAAPPQAYWFMVNPEGINIDTGILQLLDLLLTLSNITVTDSDGFTWETADGATYEIMTEEGETTEITGNLTFNSETSTWEIQNIDLSSLTAGSYKVKYVFYNTTARGISYSELFNIDGPSTTSTTTSTSIGISFSGFLLILTILALTNLQSRKRKS
ncbi:MAG: hypothetical protein ACXACP_01295 [Candidatus Hodarchaeales archaeon]